MSGVFQRRSVVSPPLVLLLAAFAGLVHPVCGGGGAQLASIHAYANGPAGGRERSGIVGFFNCGKECHRLDGREAVVADSAWGSVVGERVHIEATAGWLVLWRDEKLLAPLLPSEADYEKVFHENERGYLKKALTLKLKQNDPSA